MTSISFVKVGLAASVIALMASAQAARAASPTSACPGGASVGPTANLIAAPAGMPLNCTVAFYDGTVDFAGQVTGYATDGYTTTTTVYDQLGQVVGVTNSLGKTIVLSPERGELSTITDPLGHTTTFSYDAAGSVAQVSDPMGNTTRYVYDASERATTVTDPLGHTTSYGYDAEGRMIASVDAGGNTTTNTYDSAGQFVEQSGPPGATTTYTYDSSGRLTEVSDSHGDTTTYTYDAMNRLVSETMTPPSGGLTTTVTYDADGNVISVSESSGPVTTYTCDALNRVIQQTETTDSVMDTTTYTYDAAGDLISVTDPADKVTKFAYNSYGDLISMIDPNSGATTFAYFAVPEPSTWAAMLLGFAGLAFAGRKKTSWSKRGFGHRKPSKLLAGQRGLELVGCLLGVAPVRRDRQGALIDLERLFAFSPRLEDGRHAHQRAEVLGLALERFGNVGHRTVIVVVEVMRSGASVPAFRPVRQERDRRVEDLERIGILLDPDRLPRPPKQKIGGVRTGFGIAVQKPGDDPRGLVSVLRGGKPRVEIGALFRGRFRGRFVLFRLRGVRLGLRRLRVRGGFRRSRRFVRPRRRAGQKGRDR